MDNFCKPKGYKNCCSSEYISTSDLTAISQEEIKKMVESAIVKSDDDY